MRLEAGGALVGGVAAIAITLGAVGGGTALARGAVLNLSTVGRFNQPMQVVSAPGDRRHLFVVKRRGTITVINRNGTHRRTFLDISTRVNTEGAGALMSLAFPPDYRRSHRIYVDYSDANHDVRVDEYRTSAAAPLRASVKSRRAVLRVQHPDTLQHYGGTMQFDAAGRMYVSVGDGGGRGDPFDNARDVGSLLGKILRIYPRPSNGRPYSVPRSNPFVGKPGRNAIYSYGLRNPYRFSLDRKTRHIAIGDVGQHLYEEVDYATLRSARGANFGWPEFEGFHDYDPSRPGPTPALDPTFEYPHRDPGGGAAYGCAVIGGYVVRDSKLPVLAGRYLYTDECTGDLRSFRPTMTGAQDDRSLGLQVDSPVGFGEGRRHQIYIASLTGPVYRLREVR